MKIILISDTHNAEPQIPDGDILIHAGDLTMDGRVREMGRALYWLESLPHRHKIVIAGNHDFFCEENPSLTKRWMEDSGLHYLMDEYITVFGLKIYGSPHQPWFHDWAFNKQRGPEIRRYWDMIPLDTDILVTHGPPKGILDRTYSNESVGCQDLMEVVLKVKPMLHVFGHIHECSGHEFSRGTQFVNASIMTLQYSPDNPAFEIELESLLEQKNQ